MPALPPDVARPHRCGRIRCCRTAFPCRFHRCRRAQRGAEWLARTATQCLIDEARLSPKPGLVDSRGNGAHHDLSLALMERSAHSLTSTFQALAQQSWQRPADIALRQTVGRLGREGGAEGLAEYTTVQYIGIADPYAAKK